MTFIITLALATAACFALRNPLHKCPVAFYVAAVAVDVVFMFTLFNDVPRWLSLGLMPPMQKCMLALSLFVVVMYIGCLSPTSKASTWLRPVRAEISIIAWILSLGHVAAYLASYLPTIFGGSSVNANVLTAFAVAVVLLVLLLALGVTSFNFVKRRMKSESWKKLQKLSYLFFGLTYVHLLLMLAPSALRGAQAAQLSVAAYSIVFLLYAVLRIYRAYVNKQSSSENEARA